MRTTICLIAMTLILLLTGCSDRSQRPSTAPKSPASFGVQKEVRNGREVWGIVPDDLTILGLKQGATVDQAMQVFGTPTKASGGTYQWTAADGTRVDIATKGQQISTMGIMGGSWQSRRGIHVGLTQADVQAVYGPSHDTPDTAVYESRPGGYSISFLLNEGKVVGVLAVY